MRSHFEHQLERLNADLISMGACCEMAITSAIQVMKNNDREALRRTVCLERELDSREREVENLCLTLLLHQQPVARDFRMISSALKMITDMERIGDQAADIAMIASERDLTHHVEKLRLPEMAEAVIGMLTDSIDAFVYRKLELIRSVLKRDDIVDGYFADIRAALITLTASGQTCGDAAVDLLMLAKYFERIGDHSTNIAEWAGFFITGKHVSLGYHEHAD